jgi:hypothetical protein
MPEAPAGPLMFTDAWERPPETRNGPCLTVSDITSIIGACNQRRPGFDYAHGVRKIARHFLHSTASLPCCVTSCR